MLLGWSRPRQLPQSMEPDAKRRTKAGFAIEPAFVLFAGLGSPLVAMRKTLFDERQAKPPKAEREASVYRCRIGGASGIAPA